MYITKEQLEQRLNKTSVQIKEKERKIGGRGTQLSHEDRVTLGALAEVMPVRDIEEMTGISKDTINNAHRGIVTPSVGVDEELRNDVEDRINRVKKDDKERLDTIKDSLITNLAAAIGHVGNNLSGTDATEASKIAVDMSKILDRVSGSGRDKDKGPRVAVIINTVPMREEKAYKVVEA